MTQPIHCRYDAAGSARGRYEQLTADRRVVEQAAAHLRRRAILDELRLDELRRRVVELCEQLRTERPRQPTV